MSDFAKVEQFIKDVLLLPDVALRILDEIPVAVILTGNDRKILFVNRRAELFFDYNRGSLLGKNVNILVPEDKREIHDHHVDAYNNDPKLRPMGIPGMELVAVKRNGEKVEVEINLSPIPTDSGIITVAVIRKKVDE